MKPNSSRFALPPGFLFLWLLLTVIWIAANSSFAPEVLITGAVIAAGIAFVFARRNPAWQGIRLTPSRLYHFLVYTVVFVVEMVKANLKMLRYVYAWRIEINPGVVEIRTGLKSPAARLSLANSIALTPGSLVLDMKDETLLIHVLDNPPTDIDEATRMIAGPYERHLEKVFE